MLRQRPDLFHSHDHQSQGGLGHIDGQDHARAGDVDASLPQGVGDVALDAAAHVGYGLQVGRCRQHIGVEWGYAPTGDAGVGGREQGEQVGFGGRVGAGMVDDVGKCVQRLPDRRVEHAVVVFLADSDGDGGHGGYWGAGIGY